MKEAFPKLKKQKLKIKLNIYLNRYKYFEIN